MTNAIDKSEISARKAEWLDVKRRLQYSKSYTKQELNIFEQYFVKGQEPKWAKGLVSELGSESDPIPLIYRLWFSRDQSQEAWQAILNAVLTTYAPSQVNTSLQDTRNLIYQEACSPVYCGDEDAPIGFMGGLEERMFNFLAGDFATGVFPTYKGGRILTGGFFGASYYNHLFSWLKRSEYMNPLVMLQYMQEFWYEGLSDTYVDKLFVNGVDNVVKDYFRKIADFIPSQGDAFDAARITHCRKVQDILEHRPIPERLAQWWSDAKRGGQEPATVVHSQAAPESDKSFQHGVTQPAIVINRQAGELIEKTLEIARKYNLPLEPAEQASFNPEQEPYFEWLERLLPLNAVGHAMEQGQAPSGFYPELFERYAAITQGEFEPEHVNVDSEDDWETLLIEFTHAGKKIKILVDEVEDSDWFTPNFVVALNDFAKRYLRGRWFDLYDDDDACVSMYLPAEAYADYLELKTAVQSFNENSSV